MSESKLSKVSLEIIKETIENEYKEANRIRKACNSIFESLKITMDQLEDITSEDEWIKYKDELSNPYYEFCFKMIDMKDGNENKSVFFKDLFIVAENKLNYLATGDFEAGKEDLYNQCFEDYKGDIGDQIMIIEDLKNMADKQYKLFKEYKYKNLESMCLADIKEVCDNVYYTK